MFMPLTVANLGTRKSILVNSEVDTPKSAFEQAGIDPTSGQMMLNSIPLRASEYEQTFDELHCTGGTLSSIVKADSAC